jgi:phosphoribosyl 1,2-cyclic phosphodiesterase
MELKFWGVRGSIPSPGRHTLKYGGNTSCIELRIGPRRRLIIIDAGTGLKHLGDALMAHDIKNGPLDADLFLTHTHWDHIMGFPFFTPIYIPGTKLRIHGTVTHENHSLEKVFEHQLSYRYHPIRRSELSAEITYHTLREEQIDLGDGLTVQTKYLNHPVLCLGYKFEYMGKKICTAFDTEPFRNVFPTDPNDPDYDSFAAEEGEKSVKEETEKLLTFFKGSDILIHDSQYTEQEYKQSKVGWGHSSFEQSINEAHKSGVKKLIFFHHDPLRKDEELTTLLSKYKKIISGKTSLELYMAEEGPIYIP